MIRTLILFHLGFYFCFGQISSQTLITQSIGSAGYVHVSDSTSHLQWNAGEVIIGLTGGQDKLQQGLYQFIDITSYVVDPKSDWGLFDIFPNPSRGFLNVKADVILDYMIVDLSGRVMEKISPTLKTFNLDLRHLVDGTYYIIGISRSNNISKAQKWVLIRE